MPVGGGGIPILLIHGYKHDAGAWILHKKKLVEAGYGPAYVMDLGSANHSIEEYAHRVQLKAEAIAATTGVKDLLLIGFSMGGVVASYYALHLAKENTVKGIITLGSPLEGTRMAIFGGGECAAQIRYRTSFIMSLKNRIADNRKIPFWHIGSWADPIIRPPSTSWHMGGCSNHIILEDFGHLSMLYSEKISEILASCIKNITSSEPT